MSSPINGAPDGPQVNDVDTESLYGAAPDGSSSPDTADVDPTDTESGPPDDLSSDTAETRSED